MQEREEFNGTSLQLEPLDIDEARASLISALSEKRFSYIRSSLEALMPQDIAEIISDMPTEVATLIFRLLPKELAAECFVELDSFVQEQLINTFTDERLRDMLEELYIDDTVDIIEEMPASVIKRIVKASTPETRAIINQILNFPSDSAGALMTTEYVRLKPDMTVSDALSHIREVAIDKETIYTCYVTTASRRLIGIVTAKDLLISPTDSTVGDIMETDVIYLSTTEDREDVVKKFEKYGFLAMPVTDNEQRLVGIITVDDTVDAMRAEVEEDFDKMAAITPVDTPYLHTSFFTLFKSRIPWLLLLMVSATFSSTILSHFEAMLPAVLILFVPMLMDTGGNSGGQSSVTIIRALSTDEIRFSDILRVIGKETLVGVLCGVALGAVAFGKVLLVDRLLMGNDEVTATVALLIAITLALTVIMAKFIGSALPMLAKKIGFDPAVMASPFITTIVDALALILYFFIAHSVFGISL